MEEPEHEESLTTEEQPESQPKEEIYPYEVNTLEQAKKETRTRLTVDSKTEATVRAGLEILKQGKALKFRQLPPDTKLIITVQRRFVAAGKMVGINLTVKKWGSGFQVWEETPDEAQIREERERKEAASKERAAEKRKAEGTEKAPAKKAAKKTT